MITPTISAVDVEKEQLEELLNKLKEQQKVIEKQDKLITGYEKEIALKDEKIKKLEEKVKLWKNKFNDYKDNSEIALEKANKLIEIQGEQIKSLQQKNNSFDLRLATEMILLGFGVNEVWRRTQGMGD